MWDQLAIGMVAVLASVVVSAAFAGPAAIFIGRSGPWLLRPPHWARLIVAMSLLVLWVQIAITANVCVWAMLFRSLGIFVTWEGAVYFAFVSFTTLGFGDVLLPFEWRLLSGIAAANGLLIIGFYTAFMVEMIRRIRNEQQSGLLDRD